MPEYFDTGFSVRQPMWHGKGVVLDDYPGSWEEARKHAGLDWEPEAEPVYCRPFEGVDLFDPVPGWQVIRRSDNGKVLSVSQESYSIIRHDEMGEIVEAILDETNVRYVTAGSVKGGRAVWALAYLDEPDHAPGDDSPTYPYLALLNAHDGSAACKVLPTSIRVVCWNTYNAASMEGERNGRQFVFRHTKHVHDRLQEAKDAVRGVRQEHKRYMALARDLALVSVTREQAEEFVARFVPLPPEGLISPRVRDNVMAARGNLRAILDGPTIEGTEGTGYSLVQAAGEYLDHVRGWRNRDTYLGRTLLRPEPLKAKAVSLVRDIANV